VLLLLCACSDGSDDMVTTSGALSVVPVARAIRAIEIGYPERIQSTGRGTVFIASPPANQLIVEVDTASGMVVRTIGGIGEGPGEYRHPGVMFMRGDSLLLQHATDGRFSMYDADGRHVRDFPSDVPVQAGRGLRLRGDTLLLAEPGATAETFGLPLHLLSPTGARIRSFGAEDRTIEPGRFVPRLRALTLESDSTFWVARRDRYEIELWSTRGQRERQLVMDRNWFPVMEQDPGDPSLERPVAQLGGLVRDSHGHLIVVLLRSTPDWRPRSAAAGEPDAVPGIVDKLGYFEVVVEVLDPKTGALLDSTVVEGIRTLGDFLANGLLVGFVETPEGTPAFALYSLTHNQ
jgi:hypothetical protein